ncbi:MAG: hypothetical protein ACK5TR_06385 [Alphaproteobacteria bacterium]|nr:hypothetical protein [Alphaproteobacteria bacterium]
MKKFVMISVLVGLSASLTVYAATPPSLPTVVAKKPDDTVSVTYGKNMTEFYKTRALPDGVTRDPKGEVIVQKRTEEVASSNLDEFLENLKRQDLEAISVKPLIKREFLMGAHRNKEAASLPIDKGVPKGDEPMMMVTYGKDMTAFYKTRALPDGVTKGPKGEVIVQKRTEEVASSNLDAFLENLKHQDLAVLSVKPKVAEKGVGIGGDRTSP